MRVLSELGVLAGVYDPDPHSLAVAPLELRARSCAALLEDPSIQAVAIATPACTHFELAQQALLSGKDVLVEKPLTLREDEGLRLHQLAHERNLILMVGHITVYHPAIVALREAIRDGLLGSIRYVYANRLNLGVIREEEDILWSFAPHDIAVFLELLGEWPQTVAAHGGSYLRQGRADVTTTHMTFAGETRGHIFVSWLHPLKEHRLVVIGDLGMVVFEDRTDGATLLRYPPHPNVRGMPKETPVPMPFEMAEPLREEWLHFLECIRSREEPRTGSLHGLKVLRILETARQSLTLGGAPLPCPLPDLP
jgi:UDP-2-acetamido-3-amino-2,3-dideoxy-glucuronate N-acetyltransferase